MKCLDGSRFAIPLPLGNQSAGGSMECIHNNPVAEEIVSVPEHCLYSSARDYAFYPKGKVIWRLSFLSCQSEGMYNGLRLEFQRQALQARASGRI